MSPTPAITFDSAFADTDSRDRYDKAHDRLWREMIVDAHECVRDARVILVDTPLWLLHPGPAPVLRRIAITFLEHGALQTINALTDKTDGSLTLERLRDLFLKTCDPSKKAALETQLAEGFAEHDFESLRIRAKGIRNKLLAHFDERHAIKPELRAKFSLSLKELEQLLEAAEGLLHVLKPGHGMSFDVRTMNPDKDMRYIVNQLMLDSVRLGWPERFKPAGLKGVTRDWSDEQKKVFNDWRKRTGRPPVDFAALR